MGSAGDFEAFFAESEPLIRRAVVARFGAEVGRDAAAEAFAQAWRSWERIAAVQNPAGYVYRIAERAAMREIDRKVVSLSEPEAVRDKYGDPELAAALEQLSPHQRQAVVLVKGLGMTYREAADLIGCARSSLQNHVERGLARLRESLEVTDNA